MNSPVLKTPVSRVADTHRAPIAERIIDTVIDTVNETVDTPVSDARYAPKFDRTSDVGGALNARGRLLARAFSSQTKSIERPEYPANTDSLAQGDHIDDFNQGEHVE